MYYEINVSRNGAHLFATHERSLRTEEQAIDLAKEISEKFSDCKVELTKRRAIGERVDFNDKVKITELERALLDAIFSDDIFNDDPSPNRQIWLDPVAEEWRAATKKKASSFPGVVASAVKKGLVTSESSSEKLTSDQDDSYTASTITLTQLGWDTYQAL